MYKQSKFQKTSLNVNKSVEGESIEIKISRMINNKEPINTGRTELIYTERKEGVRPETDIRADKWDIATDAMSKVGASFKKRREGKADIKVVKNDLDESKSDSGKPETGQATN